MSAGRLAGRVALITGAGEGIGRAAALLFAAEGASVGVLDVDEQRADRVVAEIVGAGGGALSLCADVAGDEQVRGAVSQLVSNYGGLHVLYCNAGVWLEGDGPVTEVDEEIWSRTVDINLNGTYRCCRRAIPEIVRSGGGAVITTSSPVAARPEPAYDAYTASKGALISLTRSIAQVYARDGVRANVLMPGAIRTAMTRDAFADEKYLREAERMTLLGRIGEPEEVARAALYLASDESSFVTGTVQVVDGGWLLGPEHDPRPPEGPASG